jgi:Ca-activated chloride channel family protein
VTPEQAAAAAQQSMRFAAPGALWLLLGVPLALLLVALAWRQRARARRSWAGDLFARLAPGWDPGRERLKLALWLLGYACVVLALARPQWGGELVMMKRRGIDLMLAIDTSVSMLAEDMRPNRLGQAKRAVADLVARLGGDRIGLIAFAGQAYTTCPLTLDHGTVLLMLESMNVHSVSLPGTNLEDAIRTARSSFVRQERKHKALVLVTDGESTEGDPVREAEQAAEEGIVIYTIGLGSPDGQPIPERDESGAVQGYKRDRGGQVVNSRLDEDTLRRIAEATRGRYFRSTPHALELGTLYDELAGLEKKELEGQLATNYEERYQWPLGLAALLLGVELLVPNRRRRAAEGA